MADEGVEIIKKLKRQSLNGLGEESGQRDWDYKTLPLRIAPIPMPQSEAEAIRKNPCKFLMDHPATAMRLALYTERFGPEFGVSFCYNKTKRELFAAEVCEGEKDCVPIKPCGRDHVITIHTHPGSDSIADLRLSKADIAMARDRGGGGAICAVSKDGRAVCAGTRKRGGKPKLHETDTSMRLVDFTEAYHEDSTFCQADIVAESSRSIPVRKQRRPLEALDNKAPMSGYQKASVWFLAGTMALSIIGLAERFVKKET